MSMTSGFAMKAESSDCPTSTLAVKPEASIMPETPMLNVPVAAVVADPLLKKFEYAGEEYSNTFALSKETITELETPMIPKDEYIRIVNGE